MSACLPACRCVLSVIDSSTSGWLFFFSSGFNLHLGSRPLRPAHIQHPGSLSGGLALAACGFISFLIRNGEEGPERGEKGKTTENNLPLLPRPPDLPPAPRPHCPRGGPAAQEGGSQGGRRPATQWLPFGAGRGPGPEELQGDWGQALMLPGPQVVHL